MLTVPSGAIRTRICFPASWRSVSAANVFARSSLPDTTTESVSARIVAKAAVVLSTMAREYICSVVDMTRVAPPRRMPLISVV
jgi:hypothetical protein